MALAQLEQEDFALGSVLSVARHLIPENGAYRLLNALLDDDGSAYRRGGSGYKSNTAFGAAGLRFLWDGHLGPGQRTVFANPDDFGTLDADDATPVNLGGAGLSAPVRAVELGGVLFIGGGVLYGGSRKTAPYSTGTVSVTQGSKTVTGSGTTWNTLVDAGMLLKLAGRYYPVASITDTTHLELRDEYQESTAAGQAYSLNVLGTAGAPYRTSSLYLVAGNRLFSLEGNKAYFSAFDDPHSWDSTDYHEMPEGVTLLGGGGVRDSALLFTSGGLYVVSGLALALTDPLGNNQHRMELATGDLVLWSHAGIASYSGALIAPCTDGVYLVDGVSPPEKLSRSITPQYAEYVEAGYKTGNAAVFRSHYLLPILDGSNQVVDLLVCRLDRPQRTRLGTVYPWTFFDGHGGNVAAVASRTGTAAPVLLGASRAAGSRVLSLTSYFNPDSAHKNDGDGSTHEFEMVTRDFSTGPGNVNMVKKLRSRYVLVDAGADDPAIQAAASTGEPVTSVTEWGLFDWGEADWAESDAAEWTLLSGEAPENDGRSKWSWDVMREGLFVRFRLRSRTPAARLIVRSLDLFSRARAKP